MTIGAKRPHGLPLVGLIQSEPEDQGRGWGKRCPSPRRVGDKSLCLLFHSALSGLDGFHSTGGEGGTVCCTPATRSNANPLQQHPPRHTQK